ncbi:GNAT family N-acetyltransferase [Solibacillus sp. R5-41]|uniref:GNAT family N-acetyltransferase n=1 Tax=Solibacillus sp. R5-41 TaxID=2048654 RepID=UPI000C12924B|nr:GNAT family N-acetyltransferase [Solibacillus sp. R5-41]ATP40083.1 GNAT family N-acetyltransferase [Solibacillus sp. R5-41]
MFPNLQTERLILREIELQDAEYLFKIFSDDEVTKYYGMKTFEKLEQAEKLIEAFAIGLKEKKGIRWGIERKGTPGIIGTIGFNLWSPAHRRAEVGYEVHPDFWRTGYTSEALKKIVEYGFQEMRLTRIGAVVFLENEASNQLLMKQGFEKEGLLKNYMYQNNNAYDVNIYSKVLGIDDLRKKAFDSF